MGNVVRFVQTNDHGEMHVIVSGMATDRYIAPRVPWWQQYSLMLAIVLAMISIGGLIAIAIKTIH